MKKSGDFAEVLYFVGVPKLPFLNHISPTRERLYAICSEYDSAGTAVCELGCSELGHL